MHSAVKGTFIVLVFIFGDILTSSEDDLVMLPNVTFKYNFKSYSGYLYGNADKTYKLFYWFVQSQGNPDEDPVVLWLNGGPGCSSIAGAFEELGPFYVNRGSHSLYENPYTWSKVANVLFLESPAGVGFSYVTTDPNGFVTGDDAVAAMNYHAMNDFFSRVHPKYQDRTFFITGESYAGIYLPTLARLLVRGINNGTFTNPNFQGVAIGNGYLSDQAQTNSYVLWANYHGIIGVDDWKLLKNECCANDSDMDTCDFYAQIIREANANTTAFANITNMPCAQAISSSLSLIGGYDAYNFYQDCYQSRTLLMSNSFYGRLVRPDSSYINMAAYLNYDSTDNQRGYPCWNNASLTSYLNQAEVMRAFHIDEEWINARMVHWMGCNDALFENYTTTYLDTTPVFVDIINEVEIPNFRFLIYNGDTDTVCNFLGDAWFAKDLAQYFKMNKMPRVEWNFRSQIAGFTQRYYNEKTTVDVLTVKGAGHFVPNDRPGPALQMITNFIRGSANYSSTKGFDPIPAIEPTAYTSSCPSPLRIPVALSTAFLIFRLMHH